MKFEDMKVTNVEFNNWGDDGDPEGNWTKFLTHNTFSHSEACEFILYCGHENAFEQAEGELFSADVIEILKEANKQGFKYVCFHT